MRIVSFVTALSVLLLSVYSFEYSRGVLVADDNNYEDVIYNKDGKFSFINYYQTNCVHCNKLGPHIEILAQIFKDTKVQIVQLEGKKNKRVRRLENIVGFPTMRLFGFDGSHLGSFNAERNVETIANFITDYTGVKPNWPEKKVVELESSQDFESLIKGDDDLLIAFVASWLEDWNTKLTQFDKVAMNHYEQGDSLKFIKIDISNEIASDIVSDFRITKYPTLVYYNVKDGSFRILDHDTDSLNIKKFETFIADSSIGDTYTNLEELQDGKNSVEDDQDSKHYGFNKDTHQGEVDEEKEEEKYKKMREL